MIQTSWKPATCIFQVIEGGGHLAQSQAKQQKIDHHGADARIRTADLLITNQLLYQLSYIGLHKEMTYLYEGDALVNIKSVSIRQLTFPPFLASLRPSTL